tara:strand:+ start:131 stop:301 length:171 start_codon:yes stop_codon:yes gene_type:complete
MRKNFSELKSTIEVDPVTGEYYTRIPECVINDQGWFEDTVLGWEVEGDEIIITEIG